MAVGFGVAFAVAVGFTVAFVLCVGALVCTAAWVAEAVCTGTEDGGTVSTMPVGVGEDVERAAGAPQPHSDRAQSNAHTVDRRRFI